MKDINKGRICLLIVIGLGIVMANMIWGEMKDMARTEDEDYLALQLETEYKLAQADYIRKKRLKGEPVDEMKMQNALNQRKKLKELNKKLLGTILGKGFLLRDS